MAFDFKSVFQRASTYAPFLERYATQEGRDRWARVYDAIHLADEQKATVASFRRKMNVLCLSGPWCGDCVNACPIYQRIAEARPDLIDLRFINRMQNFDAAVAAATGAAGSIAFKPGTADDPDDIRSRPIGKILVKWGILTPERVEKAALLQEERKAKGLNVKIGDVMTEMGLISTEQRDHALAAQSGYSSLDAWDVAIAQELSICGGPRVPVLVFLSEDWFECERFGERTLTTYRNKAAQKLSCTAGASCPTGLVLPEKEILAANVAEWFHHFERVQWMLITSPRLSKLHGEM
jgi:hypothetical protein